jgi:hypothetical protein
MTVMEKAIEHGGDGGAISQCSLRLFFEVQRYQMQHSRASSDSPGVFSSGPTLLLAFVLGNLLRIPGA